MTEVLGQTFRCPAQLFSLLETRNNQLQSPTNFRSESKQDTSVLSLCRLLMVRALAASKCPSIHVECLVSIILKFTVSSTLSGIVIITDRCLSTDSLLCVSNGLISDVESSSNRGSETAEASCAMDESVTEGTIYILQNIEVCYGYRTSILSKGVGRLLCQTRINTSQFYSMITITQP